MRLSDDRLDEKSSGVQTRVEAARQIQRERFAAGMKLSRTITAQAGEDKIAPTHLAEALQYRPMMML